MSGTALSQHEGDRGAARRRTWRGWRGWRLGALLAAVLLLLAAAITTAYVVTTSVQLRFRGFYGWWYPPDRARQVDATYDGAPQLTAPIRSGRLQGFVVGVYNPSRWTQTVVGTVPGWVGPGGPGVWVGVAGLNPATGTMLRPAGYVTPGVIPPGKSAALRVLWRSITCLQGPGEQGTNQVELRVQVGGITRTETITLPVWFFLKGPSTGAWFVSGTTAGSQCR